MSVNIEEAVALLTCKSNPTAYQALKDLEAASEESSQVYPYLDQFVEMLDSENSYIRTRGLTLIAYNARWDMDHKIDGLLDRYLQHIADPKPVTARQCVKLLPMLAKAKPELREGILSALGRADPSRYSLSMRPLILADIQKALSEIRA